MNNKNKKVQAVKNVVMKATGLSNSAIIARLKVNNDCNKKNAKFYHRAILTEYVLESYELEPVYSVGTTKFNIAKDAGILFLCVDSKGVVYHWNKGKKHGFEYVLQGKSTLKKLTSDKLKMLKSKIENIDDGIRMASRQAENKFLPFTFKIRECSMLTMQILRELHDTNKDVNLGSSCMFSQGIEKHISERAIKFYRRSGIKLLLIKQGNQVVSRCFIDKDNNYTRLYTLGRVINSKLDKALKDNGFKSASHYNGIGYAKISHNDDSEIYAPYLDGNDKYIDILDNDVTAKNGKCFVKFEFNGTEIELKTTNGKVSLNGCTCTQCGSNVDNDEVCYLDNGNIVCQECSAYCEACEETVLSEDITTFLYRDRSGNIEEGYCCQHCADNMRQIAFRG